MSADIVNMGLYITHGKPFPEKLKMKGIATTESLIGYNIYTAGDHAKEQKEPTLEFNGGYLGYSSRDIAKHDSEVKTLTNDGWITTQDEYFDFRKQIANAFNKAGDHAWIPITSFKDYLTAEQYGLFGVEDYGNIFAAVLPKFFKSVGMDPDNMLWWMDYHTNKVHPHTHVVFMEKEKTRTNPKFDMKDLNNFKAMIVKETLFNQNLIRDSKDIDLKTFKEKDVIYKDIYDKALEKVKEKHDNKITRMIANVFNKIDTDTEITGKRLQYNSSHLISVRKDINDVIEYILQNDNQCKELYASFAEKCAYFDDKVSEKITSEYKGMFETENTKLYAAIGNAILQLKKDEDYDLAIEQADIMDANAWKNSWIDENFPASKRNSKSYTTYMSNRYSEYEKDNKRSPSPLLQYKMARMIFDGHIDKDLNVAIDYCRTAAEVNQPNANYMLSQLLIKNDQVSEGLSILQKEVEAGNAQAMIKFGTYHIKGQYVRKDRNAGLSYIQDAADAGNEYAERFLENNNFKGFRRARSFKVRSQPKHYTGNALAATSNAIRRASRSLDREKQKMEDEFYRPKQEKRSDLEYDL